MSKPKASQLTPMAMATRLRNQAGFTLIEAMIATFVLAVGLLAAAGMQAISLGRTVDASELSRVTNLASDMVERIQFNRKNATAYNNIDTLNAATQPPATQLMARGDYAQWQALLTASGLTGVRGLVTVNNTNTCGPANLNQNCVTVTIRWTGSVKSDTSLQRNKSVSLGTIIAPE